MQTNQRLKYVSTAIVCQEVPDEISLVVNISGCPHKCEGCHSQYLWEYTGNYLSDDICNIIDQYKDYITCVCFMGGEQNPQELRQLLYLVKNKYGLKRCVYCGLELADIPTKLRCKDWYDFQTLKWIEMCDYVKFGKYQYQLGGLDSPITNQIMLKQKSNDCWVDITYRFRKAYKYAEDNSKSR